MLHKFHLPKFTQQEHGPLRASQRAHFSFPSLPGTAFPPLLSSEGCVEAVISDSSVTP